MKNGADELEKTLEDILTDANWMERSLPHIADKIRAMVKLVRNYDKNQKAFIKYVLETRRILKAWEKAGELMATYLTPSQQRFVKKYMEDLRHDTTGIDSEAD